MVVEDRDWAGVEVLGPPAGEGALELVALVSSHDVMYSVDTLGGWLLWLPPGREAILGDASCAASYPCVTCSRSCSDGLDDKENGVVVPGIDEEAGKGASCSSLGLLSASWTRWLGSHVLESTTLGAGSSSGYMRL